jgi:hypothetical protein
MAVFRGMFMTLRDPHRVLVASSNCHVLQSRQCSSNSKTRECKATIALGLDFAFHATLMIRARHDASCQEWGQWSNGLRCNFESGTQAILMCKENKFCKAAQTRHTVGNSNTFANSRRRTSFVRDRGEPACHGRMPNWHCQYGQPPPG